MWSFSRHRGVHPVHLRTLFHEISSKRSDLLPLAFHVTYWDRLGWKDPFSLEAATRRQDNYGHRFGDGSYTPEMVVDGMIGLVGSHREEVNAAIEHAKRGQHTATDVNIDTAGENVAIRIGSGVGRGTVLLIGFDHEHTTKIGRGENGGRTLAESNVVRSIHVIGEWSGKLLEISERFPEGQDVAVLVESADGGIVGAGRLPSGSPRWSIQLGSGLPSSLLAVPKSDNLLTADVKMSPDRDAPSNHAPFAGDLRDTTCSYPATAEIHCTKTSMVSRREWLGP